MLRTSGINLLDEVTAEHIDEWVPNAAWSIRSTFHTVLKSTPGAAVFGRDMLFDIPYIADWNRPSTTKGMLTEIMFARTIDVSRMTSKLVTSVSSSKISMVSGSRKPMIAIKVNNRDLHERNCQDSKRCYQRKNKY